VASERATCPWAITRYVTRTVLSLNAAWTVQWELKSTEHDKLPTDRLKNIFVQIVFHVGFSVIERNQPKGVKPERERKLRSCVYWQGALKQKGVKNES
jgi:hypothetical protein